MTADKSQQDHCVPQKRPRPLQTDGLKYNLPKGQQRKALMLPIAPPNYRG
jgi:hypothetical protein